jgi:hypothetical protein
VFLPRQRPILKSFDCSLTLGTLEYERVFEQELYSAKLLLDYYKLYYWNCAISMVFPSQLHLAAGTRWVRDFTEKEKTTQKHEFFCSGIPLNDEECIVRYTGINKSAIWWMAVDDFDNIFQEFNGDAAVRSGYVFYKRQHPHLIVLGPPKGQGDCDGLVGRHYKDIKMDNRKRTLLIGTLRDNEMDKKEGDLPMGVELKSSGNYRARINSYLNLVEHQFVSPGTHSDVITASKEECRIPWSGYWLRVRRLYYHCRSPQCPDQSRRAVQGTNCNEQPDSARRPCNVCRRDQAVSLILVPWIARRPIVC